MDCQAFQKLCEDASKLGQFKYQLAMSAKCATTLNVAGHLQTKPCLRKVVIMHAGHQYEAAQQCQHVPGNFATMVVMQVPQVTSAPATAPEVNQMRRFCRVCKCLHLVMRHQMTYSRMSCGLSRKWGFPLLPTMK